MSWTTVLVLSGGAYLFKVAGLLALDKRDVAAPVLRALGLLPPALFAALVVVQTVAGESGGVAIDARLAGLGVAAVAVWRGAPFLVVVTGAVATAALLRAVW